jgi:outer membrane protein TolC
MSKRVVLSVGLAMLAGFGQAQQTVSLQQLIEKAAQYYPANKQKEMAIQLGKENERILEAGLYPQVNLTGQATYQSEVTSFSVPGFSGIPTQNKDNYNMGVDLRFPLTEFGIVKSKKELEQSKTSLSVSQVNTEFQRVRERLTNVFGNILLQQENRKILAIRKVELEAQQKKIAIGVANGAVLKSNQLVFESEILTTEQKITDIDATILGLTQELSLLTGVEIGSGDRFELPLENSLQKAVKRPELDVYKSQLNMLGLQQELLNKENKPKVFLFGQGYYGRPGYNFLNVDFRAYGIAGAGISWNINNAVLQKNKEKAIELNQQMVKTQEATFQLNLQTALTQKETEIQKYPGVIGRDQEIVQKRKEILKAAASQLENGVITSTEYLTELNATNAAELNMILHKVQLAISMAQYNIMTGN